MFQSCYTVGLSCKPSADYHTLPEFMVLSVAFRWPCVDERLGAPYIYLYIYIGFSDRWGAFVTALQVARAKGKDNLSVTF
jgi:hypothetical protein